MKNTLVSAAILVLFVPLAIMEVIWGDASDPYKMGWAIWCAVSVVVVPFITRLFRKGE